MKKQLFVLAVVVSSVSFAQEIGTEITPSTPTSGSSTQPPPPPPPESRNTGREAGPAASGDRVSAGSGAFGIRAGFGGGGVFLPTAAGGGTLSTSSVGIGFFAGDAFKLLIDLNAGMAVVGSSVLVGLGAGVGFDYLFRTPADALRPLVHVSASFGLGGSTLSSVTIGAQVGFGAEYFFSPSFSVNGRIGLAVPMSLSNNVVLGIFTVTPGLGATFYL